MTVFASEGPKTRIEAIDSLRAVAALIVLYCHAWIGADEQEYWWAGIFEFLRRDIFLNGHLGVTIFFLISGYVIPNSLIAHNGNNLRKFAISRFMRLYPAYWLSFLVGAALLGLPPDEPRIWLNLTMVQRLFSVPDLLGIYWTLFIELIFYGSVAVFFALGWLGPGRKIDRLMSAVVVITLVAAVLRWGFDIPLPAGNLMFLCLMYFGAWLRMAIYDAGRLAGTTALFLAAMLLCTLLLYYPANFNLPWHLHYAKFFLAVVVFIYAIRAPRFGTAWLAYVGLISYSIYLFHQPISLVLTDYVPNDGFAGRVCVLVASLAVSLLFSAVVFHAVERPCINLGKTLSRLRFVENFGKPRVG